MTAALNAVGAIVSGGKDVEPVDFPQASEMLPETLAGMKRVDATRAERRGDGHQGLDAPRRATPTAPARR